MGFVAVKNVFFYSKKKEYRVLVMENAVRSESLVLSLLSGQGTCKLPSR